MVIDLLYFSNKVSSLFLSKPRQLSHLPCSSIKTNNTPLESFPAYTKVKSLPNPEHFLDLKSWYSTTSCFF